MHMSITPPIRILMGPGPSNVHPRVQAAMLAPVIGHLDPYFVRVMEDTVSLLRQVFKTANKLTFPVSGTGSAGMEAAFCNFVEPGDTVIVGVNGLFGERMVDNALRCGAKVVQVAAEWGRMIEPDAIEAALKKERKVKLVAIVHAETSTGVLQPTEEISEITHRYNSLLLLDTVTSLGGHDVKVDEWNVDICYSGTQKCLSCPPGLSPFTVNQKALDVMAARKTPIPSWYLDLKLLSGYWGSNRFYHHTAPISMIYALHEALALIVEEGLEARFQRHEKNAKALRAGLEAMGLKLFAQPGHQLNSLTTLYVPEAVNEARIRKCLLDEFSIELGGGVGQLKGKIWRIGTMGHTSSPENVLLLLSALEKLMPEEKYPVTPGAGVCAALEAMRQ